MDDIVFLSAKSLAAMIREKKISSEEVIKAHIQQIERVNPKINAVVQFYKEEALEKARKADIALSLNKKTGPLHGVPFTVKDYFEVKNAIITGGTTGLKANLCKENATLVKKLLKAGAILLGVTNAPEMGLAYESDNYIYGRTNNPYNLKKTAGGSSGGEAAIIASGGSPLGLGSDLGGSIRLPAHFCGIAGIRPTVGRLSCGGHLFYPSIRSFLIGVGPMARYVEDLIYTLPILCGVDWRDPLTQPVQIRKPEKVKLEKLKIAYFVNNKIISPTTDTENTIREAIGFLARVAKKTVEVLPEPVERSFDLMYGFFGFGGSKIVAKRLEALGTMKVHPLVESFIERYPNEPYSADQISNLFVDWFKFRMEMLRFMEDYDVLISPVNASPAMEHGGSIKDEYFKGFSYVMTHSLTGWPGVVVRCGTSKEGLPIGVQIAAKPWREDIALAVALYLEKAMGGWQKP